MMMDNGFSAQAPLYVRVLRLRHLHVGGFVSFVLFECMIAAGVLLALAELVSWWAVPVLPAVVAVMVKINDLAVGGSRTRAQSRLRAAVQHDDAWQPVKEVTPAAPRGLDILDRVELDRRVGAPDAKRGRGARVGTAAGPAADQPGAATDEGASARRRVGVIRITVPPRDGGARSSAVPPDSRISPASDVEEPVDGVGEQRTGDGMRSTWSNSAITNGSGGRHARAQHTGGGRRRAEDSDQYVTDGRHTEHGRWTEDDLARQRGGFNQGRFA